MERKKGQVFRLYSMQRKNTEKVKYLGYTQKKIFGKKTSLLKYRKQR